MKRAFLALIVALLLSFNIFAVTYRQIEGDDEVGSRGTFLSTRPLPKASESQPKAQVKRTTPKSSRNNPRKLVSAMGVGYTIYKKNAQGQAVRVAPDQEFHSGDAVRITIEPNIAGYLYIFHTENQGKAEMIFPDQRLNGGDNQVTAHVSYEVPSSKAPDAALRWFVFDSVAATEHIYVVIAKQPLAGVPTKDQLSRYCQSAACPWQPPDNIWQELQNLAAQHSQTSRAKEQGQAQSDLEQQSISRGFSLTQDAPEPSVISMNPAPQAQTFVIPISLVHK